MKASNNTDNIYKEGTVITAKADPLRKLRIAKYRDRIYYCADVNEPARKQLVYFERELTPPLQFK